MILEIRNWRNKYLLIHLSLHEESILLKKKKKILRPFEKHWYYTSLQLMRPSCKLSSGNGCTATTTYTILPYLFNLWDRSKRKWGTGCSSEHLMHGIALLRRDAPRMSRYNARSWALFCKKFLALLAFLFTRTNLWKGNISTGVISFFLQSQNWRWALALHASHVALLYVVETTRVCIFLNMLIYTITYSSCFFLLFFSPPPSFFLYRMKEGTGGTGLANYFEFLCNSMSLLLEIE